MQQIKRQHNDTVEDFNSNKQRKLEDKCKIFYFYIQYN